MRLFSRRKTVYGRRFLHSLSYGKPYGLSVEFFPKSLNFLAFFVHILFSMMCGKCGKLRFFVPYTPDLSKGFPSCPAGFIPLKGEKRYEGFCDFLKTGSQMRKSRGKGTWFSLRFPRAFLRPVLDERSFSMVSTAPTTTANYIIPTTTTMVLEVTE